MTTGLLAAAAAVLALAFGALAGLGDLHDHARLLVGLFAVCGLAYAVAAVHVVRRPATGRGVLVGILAAGALFRLLLLPTTPSLSTDVYRYLWDGRLAAAGVSPYRDPPNAPALAAFRDETLYPRLNHVDWQTIYPPGAQLVFQGLARLGQGSVLAFKLLLVAAEALTAALLLGWLRVLGRPPAWVLLYAWNPLVVVELAGSGHLDGLVLAPVVAALWAATRGREGWAGALVGVGTLLKLYPLLLLPAVVGRRPGRALVACAGVVLAGYAVYAGDGPGVLGSLGRYVTVEEFNPGPVRTALAWLLAPLGPTGHEAARFLPLVGLAALAAGIAIGARGVPPWRRAIWLAGGYLAATPNLFPWYAVWTVPVLIAAPAWPWLSLSGTVAVAYLIFAEPVWRIPAWVPLVEFGPLALALLLAARRRGLGPAPGSADLSGGLIGPEPSA